jgi:hypothetical protein
MHNFYARDMCTLIACRLKENVSIMAFGYIFTRQCDGSQ